jgi:hypothetical protein
LERQLNFARNLAVDDESLKERAGLLAENYHDLRLAQHHILFKTDQGIDVKDQAFAALQQASQFSHDIGLRQKTLSGSITDHSSKEPDKGICDAILVIPCPDVTTATLQRVQGREAQSDYLKASVLVHGCGSCRDGT